MTEHQPIAFPASDPETANQRLREALQFLRTYISGYCIIVQPKQTLSAITPEENILATIDKALAGYEALKPVGDLLPALRMYQREEISTGRMLEIIAAWRRGEDWKLPDPDCAICGGDAMTTEQRDAWCGYWDGVCKAVICAHVNDWWEEVRSWLAHGATRVEKLPVERAREELNP